ncbi:hypothetical protein TEA_027097 [Camellia sinensis var. sinensis]|uniref:Plastocyanin-like domain-containing protein n=1 Tax=Camellia sinensis var. sinensis TaxID=542762 RepID=A0A4S4D3W2_CAMSN|nr:hypothetical protein TEA_027097 [Camellia sinensis var. sinensis]
MRQQVFYELLLVGFVLLSCIFIFIAHAETHYYDFMPRNPWSDGPEYVTQCAIQPGTNFTYKVIFSDEEGTLWWHAHSDWTQSSVHGAIIIMPAQGTTYPFPQPDAEKVIVLGTWYTFDVNKQLHYDLFVGADLPRPSSFVINGQPEGIFSCSSGVWMWHCHVTRHLTRGMVTAFIVRDGGTPETIPDFTIGGVSDQTPVGQPHRLLLCADLQFPEHGVHPRSSTLLHSAEITPAQLAPSVGKPLFAS